MTWIKCSEELPKIKCYESDLCVVKSNDNRYALANYGTFKVFGKGCSYVGWFTIHTVTTNNGVMLPTEELSDSIMEWKYVEDHA